MAIRAGGEVARLLSELRDSDSIRRDAAIARLRVIGARAIDALFTLAQSGDAAGARLTALKALEGFDDPRVVDAVLPLLRDTEPSVVAAAVAVLRQWVTRERGTRVLDALTSVALAQDRDPGLRLAALDAIGELPRHLVAPVFERVAIGAPPVAGSDDLHVLQEWLAEHGNAPLSEIHALIARLRDSERTEGSAIRREQSLRVRGAAHAVLATRGSTVALYDLRETFDAATTLLPLDYLTAVAAIGDASCLEPMARAWAAVPGESWWRERLSDAASDIMRRGKLTGRSGVVKRIRAKWSGFI
jgi:HEAT repeat protein